LSTPPFLKYLLGIIRSYEKKKIECNDGSSEVLSAVGDLSFGKLCTCIHKSVNHLIRFEESMSDPTNEPSREPNREPTND